MIMHSNNLDIYLVDNVDFNHMVYIYISGHKHHLVYEDCVHWVANYIYMEIIRVVFNAYIVSEM